jgi:hypothetical protein
MGQLAVAANTLILKGTLVQVDADGRATNVGGTGAVIAGIAGATVDNRTTAPSGGGAGALDVSVEYGVAGLLYTGTAPIAGDAVYAVDNQTVSVDSSGGTRAFVGYVSEVREGRAWTWVNPCLSGQGAAVLAVQAQQSAEGFLPIALPYVAFANGTANGYDATVAGWRLNNAVDDQPAIMALALPDDLDDAAALVVHARAYIIDDAVDDDVVLTLVAKINGGADVAPVSAVVLAETAAEITFTIPAASVPAGARALYLELDCAATLDTSDAVIQTVWITYTRSV